MSTYNLENQNDLRSSLNSHIDHQIQNQIIDYLVGKTSYTDPDDGSKIAVVAGTSIQTPDPNASVLIELNANNTVTTDPALKAIIENTSANVSLIIESNFADPQFGSNEKPAITYPQKGDYDALVATGQGNDQVYLRAGASFNVLTGSGNDFVAVESFNDQHTFRDHTGQVVFSPLDQVHHLDGGDYIDAGDGDDMIWDEGWGDSTLIGGSGNDFLIWSSTIVDLYGNEVPYHSHGPIGDKLYGGAGQDTLLAGPSAATGVELHGGKDNDVLGSHSTTTGYQLYGDEGADALYSGAGPDSLYGGAGNDTLLAGYEGNPSHQLLDGGDDDDVIVGGVAVGGVVTTAGADETLRGGAGNDAIYSMSLFGGGGNTLYGDSGSDTLIAGSGEDTLHGGDDSDLLVGGAHTVSMDGDAGNDVLYSSSIATAGTILNGGDGRDFLQAGNGTDQLFGGEGDDTLVGGAATVALDGGSGDDAIYSETDATHGVLVSGGNGSDSLYGGQGSDTLDGGIGDDLLVGGLRTLSVQGGAGDDVLYSTSEAGFATRLEGDEGNDTLYAGGGADTLYGGAGNDVLVGNAQYSELHGGEGDDVIYSQSALAASQVLFGDAGNDSLYGGAGNDTLYGGSGNDVLVAGSGTQTLIGGDDGSSFLGSATGTASMVGGDGQDYFYLFNSSSADTVDGGGGNLDSVTFYDHASTDVNQMTAGSAPGSIDVHFSNGQVTEVTNIEYLIFSDGNFTKI